MKNTSKSIVLVLVAMLIFGSSAISNAFAATTTTQTEDTGKKILKAAAIGAVVGVAAYALSKADRNDRYRRPVARRGYRQSNRRSYAAVNNGFRRYGRSGRGSVRVRIGRVGFEWRPYTRNSRYDRAANEGWERGYYAGFLQGQEDRQDRRRYDDRFNWGQRTMWGYAQDMGSHRAYERAFHRAFSKGYRAGFERQRYGRDNFGQGRDYRIDDRRYQYDRNRRY